MKRLMIAAYIILALAASGCAGMNSAKNDGEKSARIDTFSGEDGVKSVDMKDDKSLSAAGAPKKKNGKGLPLLREPATELPGEKAAGRRDRSEKADGRDGRKGALAEAARPAPPAASGLKAGFSDDNKQFNYFINFLDK